MNSSPALNILDLHKMELVVILNRLGKENCMLKQLQTACIVNSCQGMDAGFFSPSYALALEFIQMICLDGAVSIIR